MADLVSGVLKLTKNGAGELRDPEYSFQSTPDDVSVPAPLVKKYDLIEGALVSGPLQGKRRELADVVTICGEKPDAFRKRTLYTRLTAIDPHERFDLAASGDVSMRIIDLIAPIGKGTRGMIVSPPKAGKTMLLEKIANAIHVSEPQTRVIMMLIDERPEEVTHFRRNVHAEVLASSNDQGLQEHIDLAELTMAHVRAELECGRDVVILVDSLTRMSRGFNMKTPGRGRMMSGGLEAGALEIPRRFFGLARKVENGGSVTIIATALVDTGSRMDDMIFEEFKGTGNSEIVLDRSLAEARVYPAIDISASGTRKEERLFDANELSQVARLRRALAGRPPQAAMEALLALMARYPTNEQLLSANA